MKFSRSIGNEEGSVLVISVVILALLTVIGIAATSTTSIELQIASNDRIYKENFYQAEGAAMTLARVLENINATTDTTAIEKLKADQPKFTFDSQERDVVNPKTNDVELEDIGNPKYWEGGSDDRSFEIPGIADDSPMGIVRRDGIGSGETLDAASPSHLYTFSIFGSKVQGLNNRGIVVAIGYKKRY
jgi:hypothetical protein